MQAASSREPDREQPAERLSRMAEAWLRIASNLDINDVLQEVIDGARSLTGARYGALVSFDDSGGIRGLVTSGMTAEERRRMGALPKGLGLLGYLNEVPRPLRLQDIASHPSSAGFPKNHPPMKTFLGAPVRHLGKPVGNIYLTEKEGGREFTPEDEDTLVLFAAQAAMAITNALSHRAERQARADLEALINVSPVGVLVFDAKTGDLVSVNEETRRIVGSLNAPGRALNQLLEVMSLRTVGGQDIPLDELPTARALRSGETVIADEVVIHLPNGRAVTTLVNARPIYREDGEAVSVVATIQDITPLEEMKRQRTEFLGMMSHELMTPLTAIKGSASTMLSFPQTSDPAETRQFLRIIEEQADLMRHLINNLVDMTQIESGTLSVTPEPTSLEDLVEQAVQDFIREGPTNTLTVDVAPDLPRVMADRRRVFQVLSTLFAAASGGSRGPSAIRVSVSPEDVYVAVSVEDESRGAPADSLLHPLQRYSRADGQTMGGRNGREGLGLAICKGIVEAHGGRMSAESAGPERGARYSFTIPVADETAQSNRNGSGQLTDNSGLSRIQQARILAVDGEPEARRHIRNTLSEAGFTPVVTGDPDGIERLVDVEQPHLFLLDTTLSRNGGFELMERINRISDAPVILLSGYGSGENMNRAFELGAADYVVKPFTPTELVARVRAALRRRASPVHNGPSGPFVLDDLTIDYAERAVTVAGRPLELTATEYRLLFELSTAAGRVLTHEQLLRLVWGPLYSTDARIVRTYVKALRQKLGDNANSPAYIFTERRVGYRMAKPSIA